MDPRVEEMLLAKAMADNQSQMSIGTSSAIGAGLGGASGLMSAGGPRTKMAGGLVGAILGGALGPAVRQVAIQDSPAGALLAKAQAQGGELSPEDTINLQNILAETYREMGIA